jgi:hypothetical protein
MGKQFRPIDSLSLVARILVYFEEREDRAPDLDFRVYEHGDGYLFDAVRSNEESPPAWSMLRHGQPTEQAGRDLADLIIGYVSEFTDVWADAPTLGIMRNRPGKGRPLGFAPAPLPTP